MRKPLDHTGKTYGRLTGIRFAGYYNKPVGGRKRLWLWQCSCGKQTTKLAEHVIKGHTKSCGCLSGQHAGVNAIAYRVYYSNYADGDITFEEFQELSQEPCYYCGAPPSNKRAGRTKEPLVFVYSGLDRLDNNLPHDRCNVVPCCFPCNERKSNMHMGDFLNWIARIYKNRLEVQ